MSHRTALKALLSHWWRNPLQLFTLLIGLALATALWSGVQAINAEARASYGSAASQVAQTQFDTLVSAEGQDMTISDFVTLRRAGWLVSPRILGSLSTTEDFELQVLGVDALTAPREAMTGDLQSLPLNQFFSGPGFALISEDARAAVTALGLGFSVEETLPSQTALVDIGVAARLLEREDRIDQLLVLPDQPKDLPALDKVMPHLKMLSPQATGDDIARLTDSFHLNLTAFGLLSFAVGLFIVYGAIGLAFEQRRAMFRTLRALGVSLRALIVLLLAELLIFATLAGMIGVLLGYLIAAALLPDVAATLRGLYGADVTGSLQIRASWWASGLGMAVGGTLIASAGTLFRLSRVALMEAGTPQAWVKAARRVMRVMAGLGCALLILAAILSATASGLTQGFILLGALLIGAAFLLPLLLDRTLAILEGCATSALRQWFWADTRSQVPGLSMALMALLLAIATNVGVSTMVSSFRMTFIGWLDQRLASELYVTVDTDAQAVAMRVQLDGKIDAILPIISAPAQLNDQTGEIYAVQDHPTYRDHWPLLNEAPNVWDRLQITGHALVNEQLALRAGLSVGDKVPSSQGQEIVGIYSDYGNPAPQVIIGIDAFRALYPEVPERRFGVRVAQDRIEDITEVLVNDIGIQPDAIANQARIKAMSLGIFEQTFTVTAA
ncbi:ABC transporter permease, partial [Planktotalea sp.]|uniref:ABC transporter permease n=1 Tax=Planktotalea sp. TaxID=2029877 RepID=UPI00329A61C9